MSNVCAHICASHTNHACVCVSAHDCATHMGSACARVCVIDASQFEKIDRTLKSQWLKKTTELNTLPSVREATSRQTEVSSDEISTARRPTKISRRPDIMVFLFPRPSFQKRSGERISIEVWNKHEMHSLIYHRLVLRVWETQNDDRLPLHPIQERRVRVGIETQNSRQT